MDKWISLPYARSMTVRQLLNHTTGIPNYTEDAWFLARYIGLPAHKWHPQELIGVIANKPLEFEPGSRHKYSNSNYVLLGMILEKATGQSYTTLLQEMMQGGLGRRDTFFLAYPGDLSIANGYDETVLRLGGRNVTGFRRSFETGAFSAGAILSTSEDVAQFVHSLFAGRIVSSGTLAEMQAFFGAPDEHVPLQTGYGLGLGHLVVDGKNLVGHTGTIIGYSGIAMYNPYRHYTLVALSNLSVIEQTRLLAAVQSLVLH